MSLSNRRIPKTAVEVADTPIELVYLDEIAPVDEAPAETETAAARELREAQTALERQQQQIAAAEADLARRSEQLTAQAAELAAKQAEWEQTKLRETKQWEKEKQTIYQTITRFLYEESIGLAEQVVQQAIDQRQLKITPLLTEVIQKLPISFEKLCVTIHPETLEALRAEHAHKQVGWLIDNIDWRFDLRLGFGEFSVEEEKEYFEYRFPEIFAALKAQQQNEAQGSNANV